MGEYEKNRKLMAAKYIMEYLFLEFGALVCNDGYCIRDMNDTGVQNNIMDIKEEYMRDIVLIYHIVLYSDDINADKISVSTEGRLGKHFLSWAKKTSLNKKVNIAVILNENKMLEYHKCKDLSVLLNIDKNSTDLLFEKYDKDIMKLTPKSENKKYDIYKRFSAQKEKAGQRNVTAIQIKRCTSYLILYTCLNSKYLKTTVDFRRFGIAEDLRKRFQYAASNTSLPRKPDIKRIEDFIISVNSRVVSCAET